MTDEPALTPDAPTHDPVSTPFDLAPSPATGSTNTAAASGATASSEQAGPVAASDHPYTAIATDNAPSAAASGQASTAASGQGAAASTAADGSTRRQFVRGIALTGASTAAAVALDGVGITNLIGESAVAAGAPTPFSQFTAIAPSSADQLEVAEGFRADTLISWGDRFENTDGTTLTYGFNNDFLAVLPLDGKPDEALLFANHEYPGPFFQHGNTNAAAKTAEQIAIEQESVGNSILHIARGKDGVWKVVSPSPYNRRITATAPICDVTGPLAGTTQANATAIGGSARIERQIAGSLANCSGGITPWGTVLSCEENFQDYDQTTEFGYGWTGPGYEQYNRTSYAHYGWVVEHDPYDASSTPRKHTSLGRFRHENTAFRAVTGKPFVLYMGDDKTNEGVYKFVSTRQFLPGRRAHNLRILEEGTLLIAKWAPEGRRRFANNGDTVPLTATSGTGEWVKVEQSELVDTASLLRQRFGNETYDQFFATNRPEDVEVDVDGTVYISFTNNSTVKDRHGCVRKLVEAGNDPVATTFTWTDYGNGGPTGRGTVGEEGFSCCDNLVFDQASNLWVVTDISSSSLAGSANPAPYYEYHRNNAIFMVPRSGPNAGVAFRFANMPVEAEGTGPYFSPDFSTLFVSVQHPGEETPAEGGRYGDPSTYTSWWPEGNKTAGTQPSMPRPTTIAITRARRAGEGSRTIPATAPPAPALAPFAPISLGDLVRRGVTAQLTLPQRSQVSAALRVEIRRPWGRSWVTVATANVTAEGAATVLLRPSLLARALYFGGGATAVRGDVVCAVRPSAGASVRLQQQLTIRP